jgi:hypothetical protein
MIYDPRGLEVTSRGERPLGVREPFENQED